MKYSEFKEKIKDWGEKYNYKPVVGDEFNYIYIEFEGDGYIDLICAIHKSIIFTIDLNWGLYRNLSDDAKKDLFKVATEFAATPIEEREDKEREDNKTFDSIINRLEVIQANAEDVMNWTIEEIRERSWYLRNNLDDIIIDLEECKKRKGDL